MSPPPIGPIIRKIREKKGFTQKFLAEQSGVTVPNISKIENNKKDINLSTLNSLLIALGLPSVDKLVDEANTNGIEIKQIWGVLTPEQQAKLKGFAECLLKE